MKQPQPPISEKFSITSRSGELERNINGVGGCACRLRGLFLSSPNPGSKASMAEEGAAAALASDVPDFLSVDRLLDLILLRDQRTSDLRAGEYFIIPHTEYCLPIKILSSLFVKENRFKQRVWILGSRPEEEEIFEFTMAQVLSYWGWWLMGWLLADREFTSQRRSLCWWTGILRNKNTHGSSKMVNPCT